MVDTCVPIKDSDQCIPTAWMTAKQLENIEALPKNKVGNVWTYLKNNVWVDADIIKIASKMNYAPSVLIRIICNIFAILGVFLLKDFLQTIIGTSSSLYFILFVFVIGDIITLLQFQGGKLTILTAHVYIGLILIGSAVTIYFSSKNIIAVIIISVLEFLIIFIGVGVAKLINWRINHQKEKNEDVMKNVVVV